MNKLDVFNDKKILITGTTGFKGSYLALWLTMHGAKVSGFALEPPTKPSMFEVTKLREVIDQYYGDVRDRVRFDTIIEAVEPEIVFHLAAQPIVKTSYENPLLTFETNTLGTLNLMEICKHYNSIKTIVVVTTDKVYENIYPYEYNEFSPLGGEDPYSASKACAELVVNSYKKIFEQRGTSLATVRAGNVLGGGDWAPNRIIPDIVRSIVEDYKLSIYSPEAVRPWQSVFDCLYGYMLVAANRKSGAYNFGPKPKNCVNVEALVKKTMDIWGYGSYEVVDKQFEESQCLKLKYNKAKNELGWNPIYDIDAIVSETVEWYKNFYFNEEDMRKFTIEQIRWYEHNQKI